MLNNRPVQRLIRASGQGQYGAVRQTHFRFGHPLDILQIQDHAPADPAEAFIQLLFKVPKGTLYGVILLMYAE